MTAARKILTAQLAAAVAALLGLVLLILGATRASDGSGDPTAAGTTRLDGVVAVSTRSEVLAQGASRVRFDASATTSAAPVFVGVARADDVEAWLGDLARVDVLGAGEEGTLDIARTGTGRTAPDPARADIWAATALAQGAARLDWTPAPGQWRAVVVAGTAAGGLERVDVEWVRPPGGSSAPALVATGLVLLVAGAVALAVLRRRGRSGPDDERYDDGDDGDGEGDDDEPDDTDGGDAPDPDATTTIPRVQARRRAGAPPWARVVPLALVVTLGVTACSSGSGSGATALGAAAASSSGAPAASTGPAYPALLVPQAEDVLDQVDAAFAAVNRSGRVADANGRVIGPYAQRLAADLKIRQQMVPAATPSQTRSTSPSVSPSASTSTAGMARDRLLLTRQADWPRFFVVAGSAPGRPTPVVRVLVSPTARDPYGVWAEPVLLPGASLPGVAAATVGAQTLAPGATGLVATPEQVAKGYADVLTNSTKSASAALFAPDEFRRQVSSRVARDRRGVAAVGTVTSTHSLLPEGLLTFRTADGGAVVVAALEQRYTVTMKAGAGSVRVDERLAALGGKLAYSKRLDRTSVEVVVLTVPPVGGGLVRVVAASKDDVAVSGS